MVVGDDEAFLSHARCLNSLPSAGVQVQGNGEEMIHKQSTFFKGLAIKCGF